MRKDIIKSLRSSLDRTDVKLAKVYEGNREGTNNAWYEARAAFDLLAQFRHDIILVAQDLERAEEAAEKNAQAK